MASVIHNFYKRISCRMGKSRQEENENVHDQFNKLEKILMEVQKILFWDDPFLTCICIIFVNIVFWLIIYLDFKFYGIIFTTLLILSFEQLWMEYIFQFDNKNKLSFQNRNLTSKTLTSSNCRIFSLSEISSCLKKIQEVMRSTYAEAKLFRQSQPGIFCIFTCIGFLLLSVVGRSIPGMMSLYILLMFIMTVPGVLFHFLPPYVISSLSNFIYSSRKGIIDNDDEVEPYLPETNQDALELLRLAGDSQLLDKEDDDSNDLFLERMNSQINDTVESKYKNCSLYPELSFMPSPENSMDFLELNSPLVKHSVHKSENSDINFQSKHFKDDSSDEEEFMQNLNLIEKNSEKTKTSDKQFDTFTKSSVLTFNNLISLDSNLLREGKKNAAASDRESSSDTDSFEIISEQEM